MSFANPAFTIPRRSVFQPANEAGLWVKLFDPPNVSPDTPERLVPTDPVPEVMAAAGLLRPRRPNTVSLQLMHGMRIPTWDNRPRDLFYMLFRQPGNPLARGTFPGPTVRIPRGAIFHGDTIGNGPPPHTIHWHGIEPTAINDGVGHCSMEIGRYTYQYQPNFIGTFFYHCHRNTVQHFEFGLYGLLVIDPPDAFFSSIASTDARGRVTLNDVPIGAGRDGLRRTAASIPAAIQALFDFQGINTNPLDTPDPLGQFPTDPHAFTVAYDVEAFWVADDRDSVWSDFAPDARAFLGRKGNQPGVNDRFVRGFFNDYNADYWFITGVPVPAQPGGVGTINPAGALPAGGGLPLDPVRNVGVIPAGLNSGVAGTQIAISALVNETVLIRILDAAYNYARFTFPVDVVIISFDGRALGVPPFGTYNSAFVLPAGTPILLSTARRFECLMKSAVAVNGFATVEFFDTQVDPLAPGVPGVPVGQLLQTARIPVTIS